jgi:photosystem II stability/assembly factor-like uncharacterized protein
VKTSCLVLAALLPWAAQAGWVAQSSGTGATLYDVECVSANQCWAVGAGGTILHTSDSGLTWVPETSGTTQDLFGVDFVDSLNGWAAGSGPVILHTADGGAHWTSQPPGTANNLMDVAFADANRGWASGVSGTIVGTTNGGTTWAGEISGVWGWFWGVTCAGPTRAWVFGGDWFNHVAPVYYYNGSSWAHQFDIIRTQNGQAISAASQNVVWAVGDSGTIAVTTNGGTGWTTQNSGIVSMINGVHAISENVCYVAAAGGAILATADAGTTWVQETTGVTDSLFGVSMSDAQNGWAVGFGGRILRRTGPSALAEHVPASLPVAALHSNPVRNSAVLRLSPARAGDVNVTLFSTDGRELGSVYSGASASRVSLDLRRVPAGIYVLKVRSTGQDASLRLVKLNH